jgi:hypothetical protein
MQWIDVAGPPGSGKSTLFDGLWPPRCIDAREARPPSDWGRFLTLTKRMLAGVRDHPSFRPCQSMIQRSFAKMAAVAALEDERIYIQTGFAQRGLGIGWRMSNPEDIAKYYELMPVSLGVILLHAPISVVVKRNIDRGKDRSYMVPLMQRPLEIASKVLKRRGVPLLNLDTTKQIEENVISVFDFARRTIEDLDASETRFSYKAQVLQTSAL